jgi:hypothetical protein
MDILSQNHNFSEILEQNEAAVCNHRSSAETRQINEADREMASPLNWKRIGDTLVVSKRNPGFDWEAVQRLTGLLDAIKTGKVAGLKFVVFDFCHDGAKESSERVAGFEHLVALNAELILSAPVISVAWVPAELRGADLEFAMSCSSIAALDRARFRFDDDAADSFGLYNALSQKIGFVKAERLLESGRVLGASEMEDLLLAKRVTDTDEGLPGIENYVGRLSRRYNASYGIFRAQRMSLGTWDRRPVSDGTLREAA